MKIIKSAFAIIGWWRNLRCHPSRQDVFNFNWDKLRVSFDARCWCAGLNGNNYDWSHQTQFLDIFTLINSHFGCQRMEPNRKDSRDYFLNVNQLLFFAVSADGNISRPHCHNWMIFPFHSMAKLILPRGTKFHGEARKSAFLSQWSGNVMHIWPIIAIDSAI